MRAAGSRRRGGEFARKRRGEVGRGKEASPGDNEVGLGGGTGDCWGLPAGLGSTEGRESHVLEGGKPILSL